MTAAVSLASRTQARDPARPARVVTMCAALQGIGGGLGWSVLPAVMPSVAKDLGMGHAASGSVFGAASLGIAVASPLGGTAVDRFGARRVAGFAVLAGALAAVALAAAYCPPKVPVLLAIAAIGGGSFAPLLLTLPLELASVGPARSGAALGLLVLAGQIGSFLPPVASGAIAEAAGSPAALAALAAVHLAVVVPAIGLRSR